MHASSSADFLPTQQSAERLAQIEEQVTNLAHSAQASFDQLASELGMSKTNVSFKPSSLPRELFGDPVERTLERVAQLAVYVEKASGE
jgi:hypothetical protein